MTAPHPNEGPYEGLTESTSLEGLQEEVAGRLEAQFIQLLAEIKAARTLAHRLDRSAPPPTDGPA